MKTTVAFYSGAVKEDHKYLQTSIFRDGYVVEEKGVSFDESGKFIKSQRARFTDDPALLRIDIMEPGQTPVTILR